MRTKLCFGVLATAVVLLGLPAQAGEKSRPPNPKELLGKEAPAFSLATADGGNFRLADHRGTNIVVLTFWVSRFPASAQAMPIVAGITAKYKDKNVVFCGVSVKDDAESVKKFMEAHKLQFPSALDKDGELAKRYLVAGMPHTVVIDKDGTVQSLHPGFTPDLKARLPRDLDSLVAGKKLVKPPKGKDGEGQGEGEQK
jgi:peroxiredoxin